MKPAVGLLRGGRFIFFLGEKKGTKKKNEKEKKKKKKIGTPFCSFARKGALFSRKREGKDLFARAPKRERERGRGGDESAFSPNGALGAREAKEKSAF